jgi:tetratricopeptide (TPR) repeat protein
LEGAGGIAPRRRTFRVLRLRVRLRVPMKRIPFFLSLLTTALLLGSPALAQKVKTKTKGAAADIPAAARRQLPLFGGLTPEAAQQLVGAAFLQSADQSFKSRTEASQFFARKGYEYLTEGQADTARYRFNLAWVLDPKNPEPYRGLGLLVASSAPDEALGLFGQALALNPNNAQLLTDMGASYLLRYETSKKPKDLKLAEEQLRKALAADANSAYAWQQLAWVQLRQENYPAAWESLHKSRALDFSGIDFELITQLKEKLPDPQGLFK